MRSNGARRVDRVQQLGGGRPDARLHLLHPPRRERARGGLAQPPVRRRVEADHRRLRLVPAVEQRLADLGRERDQRQLRVGRAERLRIEEDALDVGVARDHVVVERRRVEHRRLGALAQDGSRRNASPSGSNSACTGQPLMRPSLEGHSFHVNSMLLRLGMSNTHADAQPAPGRVFRSLGRGGDDDGGGGAAAGLAVRGVARGGGSGDALGTQLLVRRRSRGLGADRRRPALPAAGQGAARARRGRARRRAERGQRADRAARRRLLPHRCAVRPARLAGDVRGRASRRPSSSSSRARCRSSSARSRTAAARSRWSTTSTSAPGSSATRSIRPSPTCCSHRSTRWPRTSELALATLAEHPMVMLDVRRAAPTSTACSPRRASSRRALQRLQLRAAALARRPQPRLWAPDQPPGGRRQLRGSAAGRAPPRRRSAADRRQPGVGRGVRRTRRARAFADHCRRMLPRHFGGGIGQIRVST